MGKILIGVGCVALIVGVYTFSVSSSSVGVSVEYDLNRCNEISPLLVTISNRSIFPIQKYRLTAWAKKTGYSDNKRYEILPETTKIIPAWSTYSKCWETEASFKASLDTGSIFQDGINRRHLEERDLIWGAGFYNLEF